MRSAVRTTTVVITGVLVVVPILYLSSWRLLARREPLFQFAADSVRTLGVDRWGDSRQAVLAGFGGVDTEVASELKAFLTAQGFSVCLSADESLPESCVSEWNDPVLITGRIESLKPFNSMVLVTWLYQGRGGASRYGFWWNGLSWSRNPAKDDESQVVVMTQSNTPIKQTVHPVTHLACARRAPVWPAAYRVR